jgi:uncharacterized phage protein (TIGR01671 family)
LKGAVEVKEIKFKVWDTVRQRMYKPQGISFDTNSLAPFAVKVPGRSWEPVGKFELLQWTGLSDCSGIDVFEGDFVRISSTIYKAVWNDKEAGFCLIEPGSSLVRSINDASSGYIMGNQFENGAYISSRAI